MPVRFTQNVTLPLTVGAPAKTHPLWVRDVSVNPGRDPARDGDGCTYSAGEIAGFGDVIEALLVERGLAVPYP